VSVQGETSPGAPGLSKQTDSQIILHYPPGSISGEPVAILGAETVTEDAEEIPTKNQRDLLIFDDLVDKMEDNLAEGQRIAKLVREHYEAVMKDREGKEE